MNLRIKGEGKMENPNDAIEMKNPMEDLVEADIEKQTGDAAKDIAKIEDGNILEEATEKTAATPVLEETSTVIDSTVAPFEELLPESHKPGFDDSEAQDARRDSVNEGGITKPKTTGPMKSNDPALEGGQTGREPLADSTANAYEVSGFHVEVPTSTGMTSQQITQDFGNLETAKASVNGDMFLLLQKGKLIACKITRGAPIICFNERQILEHINGGWRKP